MSSIGRKTDAAGRIRQAISDWRIAPRSKSFQQSRVSVEVMLSITVDLLDQATTNVTSVDTKPQANATSARGLTTSSQLGSQSADSIDPVRERECRSIFHRNLQYGSAKGLLHRSASARYT